MKQKFDIGAESIASIDPCQGAMPFSPTRAAFRLLQIAVMLPLTASLLWVAGSAVGSQNILPLQSDVIRMDVHVVVLHATVSDKTGEPVTGLERSAFQVFVDGQPQIITAFSNEDTPVAVGIVVDQSFSMSDMRSQVIAAVLVFSKIGNPEDEMFVVNFADTARLGLPSDRPFTGKTSELQAALSRSAPAGSTALYDAVGLALAHIERATIRRRVLLIISDGGDNSSHAGLPAISSWAQNAGVELYTVGIFSKADPDRNPRVLLELSNASGGRAFFPTNVSEISSVCVKIAREIRSAYTLSFKAAQDGKYHQIRLTAQDPSRGALTVHTRTGYMAEKP